jgi:hypothetical protein
MNDEEIRMRIRTKIVTFAAMIMLAGCTSTGPTPSPVHPAVSSPTVATVTTPPAVPVLPASSHVAGLPYPAACILRHAANGGWLPDQHCTPGAATSAVTQANIHTTICVTGYTGTIRPPVAETSKLKTTAMRSYNEPAQGRSITELDHLVPLELGGSDYVPNFWPQPSDIPNAGYKNTKDNIERTLNRAVCARTPRVTLAQAQNAIAYDWTTALQSLHLK